MKPFRIGIIGEFQSGKSLLINCLLQRAVATVGKGVATTHTVVCYRFAEKQDEHFVYCKVNGEVYNETIDDIHKHDTDTDIEVIDVFLNCSLLKDYELIDMPGFGANAADNSAASRALKTIDFALLIASNEKAMGEECESYRDLQELQLHNIPYYFILNCVNTDRWKCSNSQNVDIAEKDLSLLEFYRPSNYPLEPNGINIVNLMWYWYAICLPNDELVNRDEYISSFERYHIHAGVRDKVGQASNFNLINRLFNMDNRVLLELKRDFREEIERVKREICPVGTIQTFAFNSIPDGWLPCDGQPIEIELYPELYSVIGTCFGRKGKKCFCLPDLRGRFVRGWCGKDSPIDKNRKFGSSQNDAVQLHTHTFDASALKVDSSGSHEHTTYGSKHEVQKPSLFSDDISVVKWLSGTSGSDTGSTNEAGSHMHSISVINTVIKEPVAYKCEDVRTDKETRPHNVALLFCIRAK